MPITHGERGCRCPAPQRAEPPRRPGASPDHARRESAESPPWVTHDWHNYKQTGSVSARNRLVNHYMQHHVRPIAARMHGSLPQQVELEDLVQQGYLGLIDAMDRFEVDRDVRFETFSRRRIFGSIQDYLRHIDPVPRLTRRRAKRIQHAEDHFRTRFGRPPEEQELRTMLDLPEDDFQRHLAERHPAAMVAFSSVHPDGDGADDPDADAMDVFVDRFNHEPITHVAKRDLQRWITRDLSGRDRLILILYYYEEMTMREVGRALGISESRVSQRLESILACLRSQLDAAEAAQEFHFTHP